MNAERYPLSLSSNYMLLTLTDVLTTSEYIHTYIHKVREKAEKSLHPADRPAEADLGIKEIY